jgi:formate/nitrite transporter FocA (FNT family)
MAGGFITVGTLFSALLGVGAEGGTLLLLQGFGFSTGFFLGVLSGALLFTEVNVELPAALLQGHPGLLGSRILRLWVLAAVGNVLGALVLVALPFWYAYRGSGATVESAAAISKS